MGSFKLEKRREINEGEGIAQRGLEMGKQRVEELKQVKSLIDSITVADEDDVSGVESLNESYLEGGREAHEREVKAEVDSSKDMLSETSGEIDIEKGNVESGINAVERMTGITDIASSAADRVRGSLENSVREYENMEADIARRISEHDAESDRILNEIEGTF